MKRLSSEFLNIPLAHRALHDVAKGRPENSLAAVREAMKHGYGIEIDLQLSADGQAIVFHDYELDRLTYETGAVLARSAHELAKIPLKGAGECIPTLDEVLRLVDGKVPVLIEMKDQDGAMGQSGGLLEQATARAITGYQGPLAVMSYNPNSVKRMFDLAPDVARGIVTCAFDPVEEQLPQNICNALREIPDYDRAHASFISHDADDLGRPRVAELKASGANVLCWTIRSREQEVKAREIAQNITFEGYLADIPD